MREPGGIAHASRVLRERGLAEELGGAGVPDAGELELIPPTGERGPSGVLNEAALARLIEATREHVARAHRAGRRPVLVGGDCPVLLGALAAMRDAGAAPGLVMLDGHEDAWPPHRSETGEGSDSEIAIALGTVPGLPAALEALLPLLTEDRLAFVGPRDRDEILAAGVESLRDHVAFFADGAQVSAALGAGRDLGTETMTAIAADSFWLHVDLDVLSSGAFAAVDYPQPGGLDWGELDRLAGQATSSPRCAGVSVVIYNPDLDPARTEAMKLVAFLERLIQSS
jgi:arginase